MNKKLLVCITIIMLFGCVSTRNYEGPTLPQSEVSEIYLTTVMSSGVVLFVSSLNNDGKEYLFYKRLNVLPGNKTILLKTNVLSSENKEDKKRYIGSSTVLFTAKKGKTYTFSTPVDSYGLRAGSKVCINEENWDDPDSLIGLTREFRAPSKNSIQVACSPVTFKSTSS